MTMPSTNHIQVLDGNTVYITVGDTTSSLSLYSRHMSASIQMTNADARALAERIINTLDNHNLITSEE